MRDFCLVFLMVGLQAIVPSYAGEADIVDATARQTSDGVWRVSASVRHNDEGWDHYADKWEVLLDDGSVVATRVLAHPHENEQPFTRSLSGIKIDANVKQVTLRAHDSVHGYGGKNFILTLRR